MAKMLAIFTQQKTSREETIARGPKGAAVIFKGMARFSSRRPLNF